MIPLQVRMSGWMRYRDDQVADFSGGNLIAICGENGAGKSSIFDAITYALYGRHRLGASATEELITQETDSMTIEFDFELAGKRWRVHRGRSRGTLSRTGRPQAGAITQALHAWDDLSAQWIPVPGTNSATGLQTTLDGILHISEAAFMSSFLLSQGSTTKFLDAGPGERFKIISSLIDLAAYQELAEASTRASTRERNRMDDFGRELALLTDVTPEAVAEQRHLADLSQAAVEQTSATLAKAHSRAADATRFDVRSGEIIVLRSKIEAADALLARKDRIEDDAKAYERIAATIETLNHIQAELDKARRLESAAEQASLEAAAIDTAALQVALASAKVSAKATSEVFGQAVAALTKAGQTEREAGDFRVLANLVISARTRLQEKQDEYAEQDSQLSRLAEVKAEADELSALAKALAPLADLQGALVRLESLAEANPQGGLAEAKSRRPTLIVQGDELAAHLLDTENELRLTGDSSATAAARLSDWQDQLRQREEAADEAFCSRCGQPVTPEHALAEIADLTAKIAEAEVAFGKLHDAEVNASTNTARLKTLLETNRDALSKLDSEIVRLETASQALSEARRDADERVAAFAFHPAAALLAPVRQDAAGIEAILVNLADVATREQAAAKRYQALLGVQGALEVIGREREHATAALAKAEQDVGKLLEEVDNAEAAYLEAKAELTTAQAAHQSTRAQLEAAESDLSAAQDALDTWKKRLAELSKEEADNRLESAGCRNTATAFAASLPAAAQGQALDDTAGVLLEADAARTTLRDAPELLLQLHSAQRDRATWEGERLAKESEIAAIPEGHRISPAIAGAEAVAASAALEAARKEAQQMSTSLATIIERLRQKDHLESQLEAASERQQRFAKLARLLGRTGLQGALVTAALATITNHANAFLGRLTGGSLQLMLKRDASSDELDLQGLDTTCMREPRSVLALSGSQKFRCAVAIAYGIGQYTGAGGMRSIAIDEGFGSLDDIGQQQMVEELRALSDHMDKVIVVSHLDIFRDPGYFPVQIRVEKVGNTSLVQRI